MFLLNVGFFFFFFCVPSRSHELRLTHLRSAYPLPGLQMWQRAGCGAENGKLYSHLWYCIVMPSSLSLPATFVRMLSGWVRYQSEQTLSWQLPKFGAAMWDTAPERKKIDVLYAENCGWRWYHFLAYHEKRPMQLVLLIIVESIKLFLAETATQLGQIYYQNSTICWPGWPALFEIVSLH